MEDKKKTERTKRDQILSVIAPKPFQTLDTQCAKATNWLQINQIELMILRKVQLYVDGKQAPGTLFCDLCANLLFPQKKDYTLMLFGELAAMQGDMKSEVVLLGKCDDHFFHKKCVSEKYDKFDKFRCPTCKKSY